MSNTDKKIAVKQKTVIHIVEHKPTGALIPMHIREVNDNNEVTRYAEATKGRKYFTVDMLITRWTCSKDHAINLLQKYQVPAHVSQRDIARLSDDAKPIDAAIFYAEYIYALECKLDLPHSKLKPKSKDN